ncbi:MAG: hypothetical protein ACWGHH_06720 [Sulfurovaceae bacterium]
MQIALMVLQQKALALGIKCINKAIVFDLLTKVSTWATPEVVDGDVYYFVARQKISDELPILHLKDDTIYRHFKDLATLKLIDYVKIGKKDCIKLTEKGKSYLSKNDDFTMSEMNPNYYVGNKSEKEENSEINPTKLGNESEKTRNEIRHINKLDYQETKDINNSSLHSELYSNEAQKVASYLLEKILIWKPNFKTPNLNNWAKYVDLAIRADKRTPQELINAIDWIYTSKKGEFWKPNILSAKKLRDKFDTLESQAIIDKDAKKTSNIQKVLKARELGISVSQLDERGLI